MTCEKLRYCDPKGTNHGVFQKVIRYNSLSVIKWTGYEQRGIFVNCEWQIINTEKYE